MTTAALREHLGLTQAEFGQLLGVHAMTVSKWERGTAQPTPYQVQQLWWVERGAAASPEVVTAAKTHLALGHAVLALALLVIEASRE